MSGKIRFNIVGKRFGRLVVISETGRVGNQRRFLCRCNCGNERIVYMLNLRSGATVGCGGHGKGKNKKHGMSGTRFYRTFASMHQRCTDKNAVSYRVYGGRGIKCLWSNFESFKSDMYKDYTVHVRKYGEEKTTIDRIDVNGDYSKENCRWATPSAQMENRRYRPTKFYEFNGQRVTVRELSEKFNVNRSMLGKRISMGWDVERAVSEPSAKTRFRTSK